MDTQDSVNVHVTKTGTLWLATVQGVAGGMSARSLKELHGDIAEGFPFLFAARAPDTAPPTAFPARHRAGRERKVTPWRTGSGRG